MARKRPGFIVACVLVVVLAACAGDSTAPHPADDARHFDSLYSAALAQYSGEQTARSFLLSDIELAIAYGAVPKEVSVTTGTGVERWHGVEVILNASDTTYRYYHALVVYRESDVHTALEVFFDRDGAHPFGTLLFDDDAAISFPDLAGGSTMTSNHTGCSSPPSLSNPAVASFAEVPCTKTSFTSSISLDFPESPVFDPTLEHLDFGPVTLIGEVFDTGHSSDMGAR